MFAINLTIFVCALMDKNENFDNVRWELQMESISLSTIDNFAF